MSLHLPKQRIRNLSKQGGRYLDVEVVVYLRIILLYKETVGLAAPHNLAPDKIVKSHFPIGHPPRRLHERNVAVARRPRGIYSNRSPRKFS